MLRGYAFLPESISGDPLIEHGVRYSERVFSFRGAYEWFR